MIYVDSSVLLAQLFDERKRPPLAFWDRPMGSSRLLEYEAWNRVHAYGQADRAGDEMRRVLSGIELIDLRQEVLIRALRSFPLSVRTLDGLHLATIEFIRGRGQAVELASYDARLLAAAAALGISAASI